MERLPLDPGARFALAPRGVALRLEGLAAPLRRGDRFPVTIATGAGPLEVTVAVEPADAESHSHAGHAHE